MTRTPAVLLLLLTCCVHSPPRLREDSSIRSTTVTLADWGLTRASDIGHLVLGVVDGPRGDRLVVYFVGRRPPPRPPVSLRSHAPALKEGLFVISRFERGADNRLGGFFNHYARSPSTARATIEPEADGRGALTLSFDHRVPGFAGMWIHLFNTRAHPGHRIYLDVRGARFLTFMVKGRLGDERLSLKVADRAWEARQDSLPLGDVGGFLPRGRITHSWQRAWVPLHRLPPRIDAGQLASLVFSVDRPGHGGIAIRDLALAAKDDLVVFPTSVNQPPARRLRKALWLWETVRVARDRDEIEALAALCHRESVTDLFVQLPYRAHQRQGQWHIEWEHAPLRSLVERLHRAGVRVEALDGDPRLALRERHEQVLATIRSVMHYNAGVPRAQRFDGVRYDIEVYLVPGFTGGRGRTLLRQYLALLVRARDVAHGGGLSFGVDIPFWFDARDDITSPVTELDGRPMSELVIDAVDSVAIMDYRTQIYGADGIVAHALDELRYADSRRKRLFVGLETAEVPDETQLTFGRNGGGARLVLEPADAGTLRLQLVDERQWPSRRRAFQSRTITVLEEQRRVQIPGTKQSFARLGRGQLHAVIQQAGAELSSMGSFLGFAIHSYESYRRWSSGPP